LNKSALHGKEGSARADSVGGALPFWGEEEKKRYDRFGGAFDWKHPARALTTGGKTAWIESGIVCKIRVF
jgi:hypothetical protein